MGSQDFLNKRVVAWALYDWGNSAFALSVLAVLFPLFLGSYWSAGDEGAAVTSRLAWATAGASFVVFLLAPVLGAIADTGGYRKRFLFILALLGALSTAALSLVGEGGWPWALILFALGSIGYYSANVFYDALIVDVSPPRYYNLVSAFGFSLGYFGGALLLAMHVWMLTTPEAFGFGSSIEVIQFAFVSVGIWWVVFLLPVVLTVREGTAAAVPGVGSVRAAYRTLAGTFREIRQYRDVFLFLLGYLLYIGGVFTVIFMAVNFGQRLGFSQTDLVKALLITNFVGFPATLAYGAIGHKLGPKVAIYVGLAVYTGVACWAVFLTEVREFYIMAITIGLVQGGVQGMSRSLFAGLIPASQSGEFFGFYNMMTKLAHVLGPALVGIGALFSGDPKFILITLVPLFVLGALMLTRVQEPAIID
ncbi:MAG: MFS transporter [Gammaproteobacteria bacterium]|nr:MFS transporter [Gammaproteobacteria bacterium]MDH4253991.1 MFS transporter [Gammaproteobacteria bacterium]MDH5308868.1 MFS transporter [Gammaproteobacteria bacterium]